MDFAFYFNASQNCPSPVTPVDGSRELPKTCSKGFQDNRQLMFIYIYDTLMVCPYPTITPAPVKGKQQLGKYLYK